MTKNKPITGIVLGIFFVIVAVYLIVDGVKKSKLLHSNYTEIAAIITSIGGGGMKIHDNARYEFNVEGVRYAGQFPYGQICTSLTQTDKVSIVGDSIIAVYNPNNPNISYPLLSMVSLIDYGVIPSKSYKDYIIKNFDCD